MSGLMAYLQAMLRAMAQRRLMCKNQIGPGEYKTPTKHMGKYHGAKLREIRAARGVGRPIGIDRFTGLASVVREVTGTCSVARPPAEDITGQVAQEPVSAERVIADLSMPIASPLEAELVEQQGAYTAAFELHGSQRKAAAALGMNLSTFQRALKKEQT